MTGSFVKPLTGVTFVDKCPWLVYMICLTYTLFSFFSVITIFFDVASCIFKLKDFNSLIPLPFVEFGD